MTWHSKLWLIIQYPLVLPLAIIAAAAGVDWQTGPHTAAGWYEVHLPVFAIGVAVVFCVWLIARYERRTFRIIEDSFDEVRKDHRRRLQSLETFRDAQLEHNRETRSKDATLEARIDALEQIPLIHAARQRGGT